MSKVDQIMGMAMSLPSGLAGAGILAYGSEEQRRMVLPQICSGEAIVAVGVTEPGGGTDVAAMKTTCRRDGDEYVINGSKAWTSQLEHFKWLITFATLDRAAGRRASAPS